MKPDDGGPAFPRPAGPEPRVNEFHEFQDGMTLRDHFAGQAPRISLYDLRDLQGWPKDLPEGDDGEDDFQDSIISRMRALTVEERMAIEARFAYLFADAMIRERSNGSGI